MKLTSMTFRYFYSWWILFLPAFFFASTLRLSAQEKIKEQPEEWKLVLQKKEILLYSRWVPVAKTWKTRELKGILTVHSSIEKILRLIQLTGGQPLWIDRSTSAYAFDHAEHNDRWFSYTRLGLPWPIPDQDIVLNNELSKDQNGDMVYIRMYSVEEKLEIPKGVQRIHPFVGSWQLAAMESDKTQIEYRVHTKSKPTIPAWITDPVVQQSLIRTLDNLRKAAEADEVSLEKKDD